jgi:ABC-2 type transport system ATP-binding protein
LKGKDFLDLLAKMRNLTDYTFRKSLEEKLKLDPDIYIKKMSKGMKQKLAIIAAFMHDPDILILDEPTSGLDPLMQNVFLDLIKDETRRGKTILLSSHIFEEVERVCDRAGIIKDGRLIALENIKSLKEKSEDLFEVQLKSANPEILKTKLEITLIKDNLYRVVVKNNYELFFKELQNFEVVKIVSLKQSIEEKFMKYYGDDNNE